MKAKQATLQRKLARKPLPSPKVAVEAAHALIQQAHRADTILPVAYGNYRKAQDMLRAVLKSTRLFSRKLTSMTHDLLREARAHELAMRGIR